MCDPRADFFRRVRTGYPWPTVYSPPEPTTLKPFFFLFPSDTTATLPRDPRLFVTFSAIYTRSRPAPYRPFGRLQSGVAPVQRCTFLSRGRSTAPLSVDLFLSLQSPPASKIISYTSTFFFKSEKRSNVNRVFCHGSISAVTMELTRGLVLFPPPLWSVSAQSRSHACGCVYSPSTPAWCGLLAPDVISKAGLPELPISSLFSVHF